MQEYGEQTWDAMSDARDGIESIGKLLERGEDATTIADEIEWTISQLQKLTRSIRA